ERSGTGLAHHGYGNAVYGCPAGGGVRFHLTRSGSLVRGQLRAAFREADETHEWRSSSKDYADAEDDAVNQRTPKSVEGKELAPQVGFGSEYSIDSIGCYWFYCNASNRFVQKCPLCTTDLSH